MAPPASAANIAVEMLGSETGSYTSNPLLLVEGAKPLYGSTTSPGIIIRDMAPAMDASLDFRVDQNIFNQSSFDSTDVHATTALSVQGERWGFSAQQRADYDTTRTSEQTSVGLETMAKRHLGLSVSPRLTYSISPIDSLSLDGNWYLSKYKSSGYIDYQTASASLGWSHKIDQLNTATIKLNAQHYEAIEGVRRTNDTIGPSIGWRTQISPQMSASISIGLQEAKEHIAGIPDKDWKLQYTFSGDIAYKGEQDTLTLNATRSQYPYGNGNEALQTSLALNEIHAINQLFSLEFGLAWQLSDYTTLQTGDNRTLTTANAGARYKFTQELSANLSYQYKYKTLVNMSDTAQSNAVMFTITYRPEPMAP